MARRVSRRLVAFAALASLGAAGAVLAQIEGTDRGVPPVDSGGSFEVGGIDVDVTGKTADAARLGGWRLAQRRGWQLLSRRLGGRESTLGDSALDGLVSGIVVESEEIGPGRYVARLGVLFDRGRAAAMLGVGGQVSRSPPMLVVPVEWSGGAGRVFEQRTEWQKAWARFRTGNSAIDYVRPSGTGPDALLLNVGQIGRPARGQWRNILDQYGASDVLIPEVQLYRQWPGGPVIGVFSARHGPDNRLIARFTLRVGNGDAVPVLLDAGVKRLDQAYGAALRAGLLKLDMGLAYEAPAAAETAPEEDAVATDETVAAANNGAAISVQFDTPGVAAVAATEAALRGVPGVRSAVTTSLALGGVSVMRVVSDGDLAALRAALEARGWQVTEGGGVLRIRRGQTPPPAPPPQDDAVRG